MATFIKLKNETRARLRLSTIDGYEREDDETINIILTGQDEIIEMNYDDNDLCKKDLKRLDAIFMDASNPHPLNDV